MVEWQYPIIFQNAYCSYCDILYILFFENLSTYITHVKNPKLCVALSKGKINTKGQS